MKKYFLLLIVLQYCFSPNYLFAQSNTFERMFPSKAGISFKSYTLRDGTYLITGSNYIYPNKYEHFLIKTDRYGSIIWEKEIATTDPVLSPSTIITNQDEILILSIQNVNSINTLNIKKLDFDGNELTSVNLISDSILNGCAISIVEDNEYLIAAGDCNVYYPYFYIIKIDSSLNALWSKKMWYSPWPLTLFRKKFSITSWGYDGYAIGFKGRNILKINSQGDSLFTLIGDHNFISSTNDGGIIISGIKSLEKVDSMSNIIWTRNFDYDPGAAIQTEDGSYIVSVRKDYLSNFLINKIDDFGNLIWSKVVHGESFDINELSNNYLLFTGRWGFSSGKSIWLLKTDSFGNYTDVNILSPIGGETFYTFNSYDINWYSQNINKINILYSYIDKNDWKTIASNVNADTGNYNWAIPLLFVDSINIKAEDSNNPAIFSKIDSPVYISIYQPTDYISINEILMWIGNNGMGSHDPRIDNSGFYWPGGDSATITAIFSDGLVWGGKVNGEIRVNGDTYRYGLQPGKILEDEKADDPFSTESKIFKIRKDWQTLPESVLRQRLEYDYNHWPIEAGAPWDDVNEDGVYTPGFDKPKFIGDETLFYVANDLDTATSRDTYGSDPIGLEFQTTIFGFNREDLKDVVFKKYKVINKSNAGISDLYFSYWADNDLGNAVDDFVGCDTTLKLAYSFNGDNNDEEFYGINPPAIGHQIIQTPIIYTGTNDSARYGNGWEKNFINSTLSSFAFYLGGSATYSDPDLGDYAGTLQMYNYQQGLIWDGSKYIDPNTNLNTKFPISGDPVTKTGWFMGDGWPGGPTPGDMRYLLSTGPFNLTAGDTQEIVIAIPIARGTDNINSITKLRQLAAHVQEFYNTELVDILNTKQLIAPTGFALYQNYPNPFNPKTTIEYEVPEKSFVTIKIYDILGREVQTLVNNEEKVRWKYIVQFDASALASGVYFYRMQAGSFIETKKMVVLK